MKETGKTIRFVCAALAMLGLASVSYWTNRPQPVGDFGSLGQPFFENLESGRQAAALEVLALDDKGKRRRFEIRRNGNLWTIPSHYNYPAEASERLAQTASAVVGLAREALAGRNASEHERFGVLDPNAEGASDPETAGKRLILKDENGEVLADIILGKEATVLESDTDRAAFERDRTVKYWYVRRADENQTYKVKLNLNLSTRFADWIDPQLLPVESNQLLSLQIDDYQLQEQAADPLGRVKTLAKVPGSPSKLSREYGFGPWILDGWDSVQGEMNVEKINQVAQTLADLKIVGVRPKFQYNGQQLLTADLEVIAPPNLNSNPREAEAFQEALFQLQDELTDRGFNLTRQGEKIALVSEAGEVIAGTEEGVSYWMHFGKEVSGDETAIEIGSAPNSPAGPQDADATRSDASAVPPGSAPADAESGAANPPTEGAAPPSAEKTASNPADNPTPSGRNRYVMIRVKTDPELLGAPPTPPIEPVKPDPPPGYVPKPTPPAPQGQTEPPAAPQVPDTRDPLFIQYDQQLDAYEQHKTDYELSKSRYDADLKSRAEKIQAAEKRAAELNSRFGKWYYVVSAENLDGLLVERSDLLKRSVPPVGDDALPPRPNIDFEDSSPETPGGN